MPTPLESLSREKFRVMAQDQAREVLGGLAAESNPTLTYMGSTFTSDGSDYPSYMVDEPGPGPSTGPGV